MARRWLPHMIEVPSIDQSRGWLLKVKDKIVTDPITRKMQPPSFYCFPLVHTYLDDVLLQIQRIRK